jgi:hypothetical protein
MNQTERLQIKKNLEARLSLLENTLGGSVNWYGGKSLKKYLATNIFSLFSPKKPENLPLISNRWSAYCHYSNLIAFINLLDKHEIKKDSLVLVHPLLPIEYIDILIEREAKIISCDINLDTLSFEPNQFNLVVKNNPNLDLIIYFNDNGLYKYIEKQVLIAVTFSIPSMICINNPTITTELVSLFQMQSLGSILWNFGDGFMDNILDEVLAKPLISKNWHMSWFIETRVKSTLESHLHNSREFYTPILKSYYILLLNKYAEFTFASIVYNIRNKVARKLKSVDVQKNEKIIVENFQKTLLAAVPDIVFDLENISQNNTPKTNIPTISNLSHIVQLKSIELDDMITNQIKLTTKGVHKSINFNKENTYLKFFFYTDDKQYWADWAYKKNLKIYEQYKLHSLLDTVEIPNAQFASNNIVYFDTSDALS